MLTMSPELFNHVYPISQIDIYENGVLAVKRISSRPNELSPRGKKSSIKILSRRSLTKLAFLVSVTPVSLRSILTLTYLQSPVNLKEAKVHLHKFLTRMARYYGQFSYIWFMEFTKVGMAHFHVLTSLAAPSVSRETFARFWVDSVGAKDWWYSTLKTKKEHTVRDAMLRVHRHKKCFEKIRKPDGAKRYALKYALKPYQKEVPDYITLVGRFWGTSRDIEPVPAIANVDITEEELRQKLGQDHRLQKSQILPKFIWV